MDSSKYLLRLSVFPLLLICFIVFHACKLDDSDVSDSENINWTLLGRDDFNRNDTTFDGIADFSELGTDWAAFADTSDDAHSMIEITGQRVEARGDSGADWQTKTNKSIVKLKIELTTADVSSLDTSSDDLRNTFGFYDEQYNIDEGGCPYDAGVGLHSGVYKTYLVKRISVAPGFEEMGGETVTFEPNTT